MQRSAGVLVHRTVGGRLEVLLGHMGGPLWAGKDARGWTIPKGGVDVGEGEWHAARREFAEEMGQPVPDGPVADLGVFRQNRGKEIHVWAVAGDLDAAQCSSGHFEMEWPPRSGRSQTFPELDRAEWFGLDAAAGKVVAGQQQVLTALVDHLAESAAESPAISG